MKRGGKGNPERYRALRFPEKRVLREVERGKLIG